MKKTFRTSYCYSLILIVLINSCNVKTNEQGGISDGEVHEIFSKLTQESAFLETLIDSSYSIYYNKRALRSAKAGDFQNAIVNINIAIAKEPYNADYYYNRGLFYHHGLNQLDSALLDMEQAFLLNPQMWEAILLMGYYKYLNDDFKNALIDVERALDLNPKAGFAYYLRGELKKISGNSTGACVDWIIAQDLGEPDATLKILAECN